MAHVKILPEDAVKQPKRIFQVVCYMRIDASDDVEPMTLAEAFAEAEQAKLMQPENVYTVEEIDETE
jgi:hypothetical protein